jgi:hypothetical protein
VRVEDDEAGVEGDGVRVESERARDESEAHLPRCPECGSILIRGRRLEALPKTGRPLRTPPSALITREGRSPP